MESNNVLTPELNIYVAGHRGMVGSAIVCRLKAEGHKNIVLRTHKELDLTKQQAVHNFFQNTNLDYVVLAAAKVGGIYANNTYPAEFIYENMMIEANVIHGAYLSGVKRLLFLGSSCIYPKNASQPMKEESLLSGYLESTNEPYGIAKIAGIKLCESYNRQYHTNYRSIMPTNLYGPNDNFNLENSHVVPALIRKFHEAKVDNVSAVEVWGTGKPMREFLHIDDMASATVFVMKLDDDSYNAHTQPGLSHINVGCGKEISILQLAQTIKKVVNFKGKIQFVTTKPDGVLRKLLNVDKLTQMGWKASIDLEDGLFSTYRWFLRHIQDVRI